MQLPIQHFPAPDGPLRFVHIPWDSDLYEFPVAQLLAEEVRLKDLEAHVGAWLDSLSAGGTPHLAVCKLGSVEIAKIRVLTQLGFYYVECIAALRWELSRVPLLTVAGEEDNLRLRPAEVADIPRLMEIAGTAFSADRLHLDPALPQHKADERMRRWIEQSVRGGERIDVCTEVGHPEALGFISYSKAGDRCLRVNLTAVAADLQYTSLAGGMGHRSFLSLRSAGYETLVADVSLNNLSMLNLVLSFGGRIRKVHTTLHSFRNRP